MSTEGWSTWHHDRLESCSRCLNWLVWGLALPLGARCSYRGNYVFTSLNWKSQKDKSMTGKSPCLFVLAHGLRNAERYLNAAEVQVISLLTRSVWSPTGHLGCDRHNSTTLATVFEAKVTVEKSEGQPQGPCKGTICPGKAFRKLPKSGFLKQKLIKKTKTEILGPIWFQTIIE